MKYETMYIYTEHVISAKSGLTKAQAEAACAILNAEKPELTEEERKVLSQIKIPIQMIVDPENADDHFIVDNYGKVLHICEDSALDRMICKAFNQVYGGIK